MCVENIVPPIKARDEALLVVEKERVYTSIDDDDDDDDDARPADCLPNIVKEERNVAEKPNRNRLVVS